MLQWLEALDKQLFVLINVHGGVNCLDPLMLLLRNPIAWIPLYVIILVWSFLKMKPWFWWFLALTLLSFAITDFSSAQWLKPMFGRIRPCYDADLSDAIRSLVGCGGQYSMPSSHAANHFGLAMFWYRAVWLTTGRRWHWVWVWAFSIGYAQVYVGKHFPFDIVAGALLGVLAGWGTSAVFNYFCTRNYKRRQGKAVSAVLS